MTSRSRLRVLFLCTHNSARSQMAEALLRHLSRNRIDACSAGSAPDARLHPVAKAVLEERFGIDTSSLAPKPLESFLGQPFDFVIAVCDRQAEECPRFPGHSEQIFWTFADPTLAGTEEHQRRAFEAVANGLAGRLRIWMALPRIRHGMDEAEVEQLALR